MSILHDMNHDVYAMFKYTEYGFRMLTSESLTCHKIACFTYASRIQFCATVNHLCLPMFMFIAFDVCTLRIHIYCSVKHTSNENLLFLTYFLPYLWTYRKFNHVAMFMAKTVFFLNLIYDTIFLTSSLNYFF